MSLKSFSVVVLFLASGSVFALEGSDSAVNELFNDSTSQIAPGESFEGGINFRMDTVSYGAVYEREPGDALVYRLARERIDMLMDLSGTGILERLLKGPQAKSREVHPWTPIKNADLRIAIGNGANGQPEVRLFGKPMLDAAADQLRVKNFSFDLRAEAEFVAGSFEGIKAGNQASLMLTSKGLKTFEVLLKEVARGVGNAFLGSVNENVRVSTMSTMGLSPAEVEVVQAPATIVFDVYHGVVEESVGRYILDISSKLEKLKDTRMKKWN